MPVITGVSRRALETQGPAHAGRLAAEVDQLHVEPADGGRGVEHAGDKGASEVPGRLARGGGIEGKDQPGTARKRGWPWLCGYFCRGGLEAIEGVQLCSCEGVSLRTSKTVTHLFL